MSAPMQHTPGPLDIMEGKSLLHVETALGHPLGAGIAVASYPKSARGWADARLAQSASDLLAALETGLDLLLNETHGETLTPWARETIAAMRAAIAKASATTTPADGRKGV